MLQKFPFVFSASQSLPAAPRDMDATWFFPNDVRNGEHQWPKLNPFARQMG
jgi:hypothetical protein